MHRALSDCYYISEVFKKCDNLEQLLLKATEPRFLYKALVSYEERSLAKNAGFRWNSPVQGAWSKKLTTDEAKNLDFSVEILNWYLLDFLKVFNVFKRHQFLPIYELFKNQI